MLPYVKYAAKAVVSSLATVIACLCMILSGDQTLADVSFVQWLWIAGLVLASFGFVYVVPNGARPGSK